MIGLQPVPPEEAHGQRGHASGEAVRVHHSPPSSLSQVTEGHHHHHHHHHHHRKRTKRDVRDALPRQPTAWPDVVVVGGGGSSQEQYPAADGSSPGRDHHRKGRRTHDANGALPRRELAAARYDEAGAAEPKGIGGAAAQSQHGSRRQRPKGIGGAIVGVGGGNERLPAARRTSPGGGRASDHAAAASDPSPGRIRQPAAAPTRHVHAPEPAKAARRPRSASASAASEPEDDDEFFRRGVLAYSEMDSAHREAAVNDYVRRQRQGQLLQGSGFSFYLTAERSRADVDFVYDGTKNA